MQIEYLSPDIMVATGNDSDSNATLFLSGRNALMVDALGSREDADEIERRLAQEQIAVQLIVLTHCFSDHLAALHRFPGAPLIAHERAEATRALEQHLTEEQVSFYRPPTLLLKDAITIQWGRHRLEISHHPGHTPCALLVDVPTDDLLLSGDLSVGNIAYLKYAQVQELERSLEWALARGRKRVVQGHGPVGGSECFAHALHYVSALRKWSRNGRNEALPLDTCLPKEVTGNDFEEIFHQCNVALARDGLLHL